MPMFFSFLDFDHENLIVNLVFNMDEPENPVDSKKPVMMPLLPHMMCCNGQFCLFCFQRFYL